MSAATQRIVIATGNAGKLREIAALLGSLDVSLVRQSELGVSPAAETADSFTGNALQKARHAAAATGLAAIADDSGLVVEALGGRPGIHSARYAGVGASDEENLDKLLRELQGIDDRSAYFHCAAVYLRNADDEDPVVVEASWPGEITTARRGSGGFGYDPVFFVPELGCTSAELSADRKNQLSHRGQAFRELAARLRRLLA
ncbi:MAG: RdgB/HAM1 family non-canonical purine NTP pyrophosphatase [Woeseiaceae bacterium]|nr:RdgB/HAM1 family non-canonical purine NTP pyrophosphatase [Woeseiaceae bacterium]